MNEDLKFAYKVRQILDQGTDALDPKLAIRLHQSRQVAVTGCQLTANKLATTTGHFADGHFSSHLRTLLAAVALTLGAIGAYYWNSFEQASEYEEIDSALLADELPPSAYLDRGFHTWLENDSQQSSE
ncbi:MAG TPA: DUF3619 family protein [Rhodocyclaceae bacterium]|nr:DUF3619 family protein [Rhodocyclaceae bacterium]